MKKVALVLIVIFLNSCSYLDVVPDNVATLDNAFSMRSTAEKYLFTCYTYLPRHATMDGNPAFTAGDEIWFYQGVVGMTPWQIAIGNQNVVDPYLNFWSGEQSGRGLFRAIRDCNIFLENIIKVRDIDDYERDRWIAEVKFLKAYYHFWLLRMYGPIPIIRSNLSIDTDVVGVKVQRDPIDECINYIVELLDESTIDLPLKIDFEIQEHGRITKPIAMSMKALVLTTAASPLFNGNEDFAHFKNPDGVFLFSQQYDESKWDRAALACKEAIEVCHSIGMKLHYYSPGGVAFDISEETKTELSIRNSVTQKWNSEIIWGNTNSMADATLQRECIPRLYSTDQQITETRSRFAPPIKMAELFYSANGVPIDEDVTWNYSNRYKTRVAEMSDSLYIRGGYETAVLHFEREPRFYASIGFDGGRWYGQGRNGDSGNFYVETKAGQTAAGHLDRYSVTGYWPKKLVNYLNVVTPTGITWQSYPWPVMRLSELYLLYSEALNESKGPTPEVFEYLNLIRARAGLNSVQDSWRLYSSQPGKPNSKAGLREIIHQERLIELAFEGHRFWDLRRWKKAVDVLNTPITGWDISQSEPESFYRVVTLFNQEFKTRDYFWPIKEHELLVNKNLLQFPGW